MSFTRLQRLAIGGWLAMTSILVVGRLVLASPLSIADGVGLLLALAPAAVFMVVFKGPPQQTVAQLIYEVEIGPPARKP